MKDFFKLIRIQNLVMLALMQIIVKFTFLDQAGILLAISNFTYSLLILATICIAAGGYIINDIFDYPIDRINKPNQVIIRKSISEKTAYNAYFILTIIGVLIGFYLSNVVQRSSFATTFVVCAGLLYLYSSALKQIPFLGNIIIALLTTFSILIVGLFCILPAMYSENQSVMMNIFSILVEYGIFAFLINFAREIVKTIEDKEGDAEYEITTCATYFGTTISKIVLILTLVSLVAYLGYFSYLNILHLKFALAYFVLVLIIPILSITYSVIKAQNKNDYTAISKWLKIEMILMMISLSCIVLNGKYA